MHNAQNMELACLTALIALCASLAPRARVTAALLCVAAKVLLGGGGTAGPVAGVLGRLGGLLSAGQLGLAWVLLHPRLFPTPPRVPPSLLRAAGLAWVLLGVVLPSAVPAPVAWMVETAALVAGLGWRLYLAALQLRATPPLALATPVLGAVMPMFSYTGDAFFAADGVPEAVAARRRQSLRELTKRWGPAGARDADAPGGGVDAADRLARVRRFLADTRFTKTTKAFFPFQKGIAARLDPTFVLDRVTEDNHLVDVDGTRFWDADCSFGVNVLGYKHYQRFLAAGFAEARERSVCLGKLTPQVERNAERICRLANKEQCSFHMSGTEAIMGAVRLARFNTGRPLVCVFGGAYHGWYDGVMQLGTTRPVNDLLVLKFGSEHSLDLLRARRCEIAAVLVNPLCALDVNKPPPADFSLLSNTRGKTAPDVEAYGAWLRRLVATCREAGIVSVFDEVYVGFRYARVSLRVLSHARFLCVVQNEMVCRSPVN
jgi:glutamate-1-semialdehyde 2,1-aminomutase